MSNHVYKKVELVGSSQTSVTDAIETAISRASKTMRNLDWFEVEDPKVVTVEYMESAFDAARESTAEGQRRRKLAEWITHPDNPLTRRVIANRLWHHHFGQGIVTTPSDFGLGGDRPSHPELLDWLARRYDLWMKAMRSHEAEVMRLLGEIEALVAEVQAVENADRERQWAGKSGKSLNGAENLHAWGGSFSRGACGPQGEGRSRPV